MMSKKIFLLALFLVYGMSMTDPASAAVNNWQKGVSIRPNWETDIGSDSFKVSIDNLTKTKSNYVTLIIPLYQDNPWATTIYSGWNTPTDESLVDGINYIHSKGMKVNLKIHVETYDGQWRAHINPGDRNVWFNSYAYHLVKYAGIAQIENVTEMTIGAELINMAAHDANPTNTENWKKLISKVRAVYSGTLTYSANWGGPGWTDEKNRIQFWPQLDYIGVSAYYPLPTNDTSVEGFKKEWDKINKNDLIPLKNKFNKPMLFTEVGYRSIDWAHWAPFEFNGDGNYDAQEQAKLYEALYSYWNNYDYIKGVYWWEWSSDPNQGGNGNKEFTPQHKAAEGVMTTWHSEGSSPVPEPSPNPEKRFTATATARPSAVATGQPTSVTAEITHLGEAINDTIIDVEIYNNNGNKIHQVPYTGQNFLENEKKTYTVSWTPQESDTYTIKLGVFNNNWIDNYLWVDNASTITAQGGSPPPPDQEIRSLDIWWPTEGAIGNGLQPFKAMVDGLEVEGYDMYWQVDGGVLNKMYSNYEGYPHKEVLADLTSWKWSPRNSYKIKFIAKNTFGNVLIENEITIIVQ